MFCRLSISNYQDHCLREAFYHFNEFLDHVFQSMQQRSSIKSWRENLVNREQASAWFFSQSSIDTFQEHLRLEKMKGINNMLFNADLANAIKSWSINRKKFFAKGSIDRLRRVRKRLG